MKPSDLPRAGQTRPPRQTRADSPLLTLPRRLAALRGERGWTLRDLAERSGVSRAMLSRIERGEASPTAALLGRIGGAFELSLSDLLAGGAAPAALANAGAAVPEHTARAETVPAATGPAEGGPGSAAAPAVGQVLRADDQAVWQDPQTGYVRRQLSPLSGTPAQLVEVRLPAGARVAFPASAYSFSRHLVWLLEGRLDFTEGAVVHRLEAGDCLALGTPADCEYHNPGTVDCRYVVTLIRIPA